MEASANERWRELINIGDSPASEIELMRMFVRDFPEVGAAWQLLGVRLTTISRFTDSEFALRKAISLIPAVHHAGCFAAMGELFKIKGDFVEAERWFRRGIEHNRDDAESYIRLGAMFARLGRFDDAEGTYRGAIACTRGCVHEAHYDLGLLFRAQERYEEAIACFDAAIKLQPQYKIAKAAKRDVKNALRLLSEDTGES